MSLDATIYDLLSRDTTIASLVGGRISPVVDETVGETRDRLIYRQIGGPRDYTCDGPDLARYRYQITAWSPTHAGVCALADAVRSLFSSGYPTSTIKGVFIDDEGDLVPMDSDESTRQYGRYIDLIFVVKG